MVAGSYPLPKRPLTEAEAAEVWRLHQHGYSLNRLTVLVYGHKDGKGFGWIKQAVEGPVTAASQP
jgi:hypothetical protein